MKLHIGLVVGMIALTGLSADFYKDRGGDISKCGVYDAGADAVLHLRYAQNGVPFVLDKGDLTVSKLWISDGVDGLIDLNGNTLTVTGTGNNALNLQYMGGTTGTVVSNGTLNMASCTYGEVTRFDIVFDDMTLDGASFNMSSVDGHRLAFRNGAKANLANLTFGSSSSVDCCLEIEGSTCTVADKVRFYKSGHVVDLSGKQPKLEAGSFDVGQASAVTVNFNLEASGANRADYILECGTFAIAKTTHHFNVKAPSDLPPGRYRLMHFSHSTWATVDFKSCFSLADGAPDGATIESSYAGKSGDFNGQFDLVIPSPITMDGTEYPTLAQAFEATKDGGAHTVSLNADVTEAAYDFGSGDTHPSTLTIDLGGHVWTVDGLTAGRFYSDMTVKVKDGSIRRVAAFDGDLFSGDGTISLQNVEIEGVTGSAQRLDIGVNSCTGHTALFAGSGTSVCFANSGDTYWYSAAHPAVCIGRNNSKDNSLTVTDGAIVTADGNVLIGHDTGNDAGNRLLILNGGVFNLVARTAGSATLAIGGYAGASNEVVVSGGGTFNATNANAKVQLGFVGGKGNPNRFVVERGGVANVSNLCLSDGNGADTNAVLVIDGGTFKAVKDSNGQNGKVSFSKNGQRIVLRGTNPRLETEGQFGIGNGSHLIEFNLDSSGADRADYMIEAASLYCNSHAHRFEVNVPDGLEPGRYRLLHYGSSTWATVDMIDMFEVSAPDSYRARFEHHYSSSPSGGFTGYFDVIVKKKLGLSVLVR